MSETAAKGKVTMVDISGLIDQLGAVQQEQASLLHTLERRLQAMDRRLDQELQVLSEAVRLRPTARMPRWLPLLALALGALAALGAWTLGCMLARW